MTERDEIETLTNFLCTYHHMNSEDAWNKAVHLVRERRAKSERERMERDYDL